MVLITFFSSPLVFFIVTFTLGIFPFNNTLALSVVVRVRGTGVVSYESSYSSHTEKGSRDSESEMSAECLGGRRTAAAHASSVSSARRRAMCRACAHGEVRAHCTSYGRRRSWPDHLPCHCYYASMSLSMRPRPLGHYVRPRLTYLRVPCLGDSWIYVQYVHIPYFLILNVFLL